jgi:hypothetical protein
VRWLKAGRDEGVVCEDNLGQQPFIVVKSALVVLVAAQVEGAASVRAAPLDLNAEPRGAGELDVVAERVGD